MKPYLILRLAGPMQAWGQPTFEGTRPTARFPTRSGLLGLLGACLGIQRDDRSALQALSESVRFAVRCDQSFIDGRTIPVTGLRDYHTVMDAREDYRGLKSHEPFRPGANTCVTRFSPWRYGSLNRQLSGSRS